jgi:NADH-quinone oxidoreductase subunit G
MATITIDGKPCTFEGKKMILQVALDHGIEIPHYCYHPALSIVASCRICLAEIEQPNPRNDNKPELIPKLMPTCQTPATDGMVVHVRSPKTLANQKAVMEFLLINHPLDCPVCDQAGECHLQDYSYKYGRGYSRFEESKIKQPVKDLGPYIKLYADRCIMCSRCVRFTREITGTSEIGVFGRGSKEQIDVFPGKPLDKDFLFAQRVWFLTRTPSIDPVTASGDNIWIHHNEGRIYRIKPRVNPDVNQHWITDEVRYGWKFVHSEDRLTQPQRQQLGEPIDAQWPRAIEAAIHGLQEAARKPGSLAAVISPMLASEEAYLLARFIRGLDPKAAIAMGPVPRQGEDKTFASGFTISGEKVPNRRGVERVLDGLGVQPVPFDEFQAAIADKKSPITAMLITGNYPSKWTTGDMVKAVGRRFTVMIETLANDLTAKAGVLLPSVTWAEKAGVFENHKGRIQAFDRAIPPLEGAKAEGQIAMDLMAACGQAPRGIYDPARVREELGGVFVTDVHYAQQGEHIEADMEYVEL